MNFNTNFGRLATAEKIFKYTFSLKPALSLGTLFSDGTEFFRFPEERRAQRIMRELWVRIGVGIC